MQNIQAQLMRIDPERHHHESKAPAQMTRVWKTSRMSRMTRYHSCALKNDAAGTPLQMRTSSSWEINWSICSAQTKKFSPTRPKKSPRRKQKAHAAYYTFTAHRKLGMNAIPTPRTQANPRPRNIWHAKNKTHSKATALLLHQTKSPSSRKP